MKINSILCSTALLAAVAFSAPAHAVSLGTFQPGSKGSVIHYGDFEDVTWSFDRAAFGSASPVVKLTYFGDAVTKGAVQLGGGDAPGYEASVSHADFQSGEEGWVVRNRFYVTAVLSNFDEGLSEFKAALSGIGGDVIWGRHIIGYEVSPVPIPAAGWLLLSALGAAGFMRRNKA